MILITAMDSSMAAYLLNGSCPAKKIKFPATWTTRNASMKIALRVTACLESSTKTVLKTAVKTPENIATVVAPRLGASEEPCSLILQQEEEERKTEKLENMKMWKMERGKRKKKKEQRVAKRKNDFQWGLDNKRDTGKQN